MEVLVERAAGLDVHKRTVTGCVRIPGPKAKRTQHSRTFGTTIPELQELAIWLTDLGVTDAAMEATGVFWEPVWDLLEPTGIRLKLVNARHVKMVPGRKTDVADSAWLAQLLEAGLLRGSFIPPRPIRDLRDLTRCRKRMVQERTSEIQRVEKNLEKAGIKLASVASKTLGVSGRAMLDALVAGETDPDRLAELARGRLRAKLPELRLALANRFTDHHRHLLAHHLARVDDLTDRISRFDDTIAAACTPYQDAIDRLRTIPGVGETVAQVLVAEIGVDMSSFPTASHLASWAGVAPGNNESAGKHRPAATSHANPWLADALCQAAWAAARTKDTYLSAKFRRLSARIGPKKAVIAIAHTIVLAIWHMHTKTENYHDLGSDWHARRTTTPDHEIRRLLGRLDTLGYKPTTTVS